MLTQIARWLAEDIPHMRAELWNCLKIKMKAWKKVVLSYTYQVCR
jgi:hypothetical protein